MNKVCFIDGVVCTRYKAELLDYDILPVEIKNYDEWLDGAIQPIELKERTFNFSKITIKYFIDGITKKDSIKCISELLNRHIKAKIKFSDLNLTFNTFLQSHSLKHISDQYYELTLTLKSDFKLDQDKSIEIDKSCTIECTSNVETPIKLTLIGINDKANFNVTLNDSIYKIKYLKTDDILEIDGENYTIKYNGEDNLNLVDIWEFPYLTPGDNTIQINVDGVKLKINYTER